MKHGPSVGCPPRHWGSWLGAYRPAEVDPAAWAAVQPMVLDAAERLGCSGRAIDRAVVRALGRLAAWAVGQGLPVELEVILDPDTVERFVTVGLAGDRSAATYRSTLRR